jgi:pyruvate/2-oxoglutarate dehydrogenase complex dihydrolipoamide acyltransferase (E2) component
MIEKQLSTGLWYVALVAAAITLCGVGEAAAQAPTKAQQNAIRSACRSDYMAHCSSVPPGGRASLECLQQNLSSLSPACQSAVNAIGGGAAPAPAASQPEATPPPAAPAAAEPAPAAPAAAAAAPAAGPAPMSPRQEMRILRFACGPDYRALCGGIPPGGGRVVACLRSNAASLSPSCRRALMGAMRH